MSSWMTANLFVNFSKSEFLLIGLKQQFAKIYNSSLNIIHSAHLGLTFDEQKYHLFSVLNFFRLNLCIF